jgi:hypothetical protein
MKEEPNQQPVPMSGLRAAEGVMGGTLDWPPTRAALAADS